MPRKRLRNGVMPDSLEIPDQHAPEEITDDDMTDYHKAQDTERPSPLPRTSIETRDTCTYLAPVTTDEVCVRIRNSIDYSQKITRQQFMNGSACRPARVYSDGIYDMFHSGHGRQLMQAKRSFPNVYLIIGVCNDELTHRIKGRTVMSQAERYEAVRYCRYVDEVIIDAPWSATEDFIQKHKIDFVAHDDLPYQDDIYNWLKERDIFVATQRTEGVSTTDMIARIVKDYDMYVRRNLECGYTAKELNVSFMKEKKIQFQEKVGRIKGKIDDKRHEVLNKWEEMSRDFITNFTDLFGRDGRINHWISVSRQKVAGAISESPSSSGSSSPSDLLDDMPPSKRPRLDAQFTEDDEVDELEIAGITCF